MAQFDTAGASAYAKFDKVAQEKRIAEDNAKGKLSAAQAAFNQALMHESTAKNKKKDKVAKVKGKATQADLNEIDRLNDEIANATKVVHQTAQMLASAKTAFSSSKKT